ncbi:hypothetical protein [Gluconobacter sphaericus]|uniref:Uncharacterized protein n=1 Tax=Gluconobacter sphaericus NBRC 12467 TaxID=1307951 RepID=A0AA37SJI8_9PROT|nr:hypothetical protein [Gluconobacter sphaericus]MBF0885521.1 hypothetical protein [Gluconobacter sphaericus]GBR56463.1 hypothetical protein AA12467_2624 [Gluconobacter sphaericus NBRC 12467]GEB42758.1 hypothetical protein GSP01_15400 [Gluconobacter sphaericus NBRC 12467]GLQ84734.1 hypothetical protein GCM10007872_16420 [Gluconobacter sphaericus NBRC 12467]GLQ85111.1 hypothetical protein GCM10007872_20190 [Gluconobacter sphaericus NBRC 12467]
MSSEEGEQKKDDLSDLFSSDTKDKTDEKLDEAFSRMENDLTYYKSKLCSERFCWTIGTIILLDLIFFEKLTLWPEPLVICAFEVVLLAVMANRLGIKEVSILLYRVIDGWAGQKDKS